MRDYLRAHTQPFHERAERAFARFDLTTSSGYEGFLQAQAAAVIPIEDALESFGAARLLPDWAERRRSGAVRSDLATLGAAHDPAPSYPAVANDAEAWGALYVIEGSKIGARFLLGRIRSRATQFLSHRGGPDSWRDFVARLNGLDSTQSDDARRGAVAAFAFFERAALGEPIRVAS